MRIYNGDENEDRQNGGGEAAQDGAVTTRGAQGLIHCMTIIGQIEGHTTLPNQTKSTKYEHMIPQLAAIEESPEIAGLILLINTVGGDVEAGLAIAELISGMRTPTVSLVLGGGHSIGVPLAVAARRSFIAPSASMMIHPVRFNGLVIGTPQTFDYLLKVQDRIVNFITANSNIEAERLRGYMLNMGELTTDVGSMLDGEEAVACGLIDQLGGIADALDWLHGEIAKNKGAEDEK